MGTALSAEFGVRSTNGGLSFTTAVGSAAHSKVIPSGPVDGKFTSNVSNLLLMPLPPSLPPPLPAPSPAAGACDDLVVGSDTSLLPLSSALSPLLSLSLDLADEISTASLLVVDMFRSITPLVLVTLGWRTLAVQLFTTARSQPTRTGARSRLNKRSSEQTKSWLARAKGCEGHNHTPHTLLAMCWLERELHVVLDV